jgi:two-component system response regulator AtoC
VRIVHRLHNALGARSCAHRAILSFVDPRDKTQSYAWELDAEQVPRVLVFWDGGNVSRALPAGERLTVGRAVDSALHVLHASVSRRHIEIIGGDPPRVRDLGSANGTRVGGRLLRKNEEVDLSPGDVVEIGKAIVIVREATTRALAFSKVATSGMADVNKLVQLVASSELSVILLGETGVGKEVTADTIHRASPRAKGPFVRVNCAAIAPALLDSELFGHEKGAFTGAATRKVGLIESADGGTLFLDEIGEATLDVQTKLLRTLESREVRRVGSVDVRLVDVRFIAATNRDLPALAVAGAFRRDLYFRLNGVTIMIPPLRERRDEILVLARTFLERAATARGEKPPAITSQAAAVLEAHDYPGNVRELKNLVERALVFSGGNEIRKEHLMLKSSSGVEPREPETDPAASSLHGEIDALERQRILDALDKTAGNQTRAAKLLGIARRTLIHRMESYGLPRPRKP